MKCRHCRGIIIKDLEGDFVHKKFIDKGVDSRMCHPTAKITLIAEPEDEQNEM